MSLVLVLLLPFTTHRTIIIQGQDRLEDESHNENEHLSVHIIRLNGSKCPSVKHSPKEKERERKKEEKKRVGRGKRACYMYSYSIRILKEVKHIQQVTQDGSHMVEESQLETIGLGSRLKLQSTISSKYLRSKLGDSPILT